MKTINCGVCVRVVIITKCYTHLEILSDFLVFYGFKKRWIQHVAFS